MGSAEGIETFKPAHGLNGKDERVNNWEMPGPAAFDFRSDTSTTPTLSMLNSITYTTLLDDVLHADPTTNALESRLATLLSHESATLVSSGTMGNQLAVRIHMSTPFPPPSTSTSHSDHPPSYTSFSGPPHSLLADSRSHILNYEAGGIASLSQAFPISVSPSPQNPTHLTLEDIIPHVITSDDEHFAPTALICLENTIHGAIIPLAECQRISAWAHARGIRTHLDGARLWEAVAAEVSEGQHGRDLETGMRAYGACFDSVTVCFSKGLGAPLGSMLVSSERFIKRARHVRKSWGGGMRQTGLISAPARVAMEETFFGGQLVGAHEVARRIGVFWEERGGKLVRPVETNMVWLDLGGWEGMERVFEEESRGLGVKVYGGKEARVVCHYQICEEAIQRMREVMERVLDRGRAERLIGEEREGEVKGDGEEDGEGFQGYGNANGNGLKRKKPVEDALDGDESVPAVKK